MSSNPILKKLGYSDTDRLVITHGDDIGMCQASIQAYEDLFAFGTLKSGAVMVPCPWFPAAAMQKHNPTYDLGVHLVLTSEWAFCRWRPLTVGVTGSSLMDEDEVKTGHQRAGMYFGMSRFLITLSGLLVSSVFGLVMPAFGYDTLLDVQSATVDLGFRIFLTVPTTIGFLLAITLLWLYPLHGKKLTDIREVLEAKKGLENRK